MAKARYFLLCENFTRDTKGRVSLINIFDIIGAENLPFSPGKFTIAFSVDLEKGEVKNDKVGVKITISDKGDKEILRLEGDGVVVFDEGGNAVSSVDLSGRIPFKKDGTHYLRLYINGKKIAESTFSVVKGGDNEFSND